ncbi:uncharacterized protein LOC123630839 [Lemur catta]|uniref:uncharacterized protein LOC123630839 n=1 Tax=Lemur catta TaxID=9447 RepID=UPI001E2699A9|nr:uncharacterized protein LOC123630839 [Lemur catta]
MAIPPRAWTLGPGREAAWPGQSPRGTYLILLKTMSASVTITFFPSITWQSLHSFDQFLPCIFFPVARVSPCTAKHQKASCRALSAVGGGVAPAPSLAPLDSSDSRLAALSLAGSPGDLGGVLLAALAGLALLSAMWLWEEGEQKGVILLLTGPQHRGLARGQDRTRTARAMAGSGYAQSPEMGRPSSETAGPREAGRHCCPPGTRTLPAANLVGQGPHPPNQLKPSARAEPRWEPSWAPWGAPGQGGSGSDLAQQTLPEPPATAARLPPWATPPCSSGAAIPGKGSEQPQC